MAELLCGVVCPARGERRVFWVMDAALGDRRKLRDRLVVNRAQQGALSIISVLLNRVVFS